METRQVVCDHCGRDLTFAERFEDWSIRLINRRMPCKSSAVVDVMFQPHLEHDYDFCGLGCMNKFLGSKD